MKTKISTILAFSILIVCQSCELENVDYTKITPDNFYKTQNDAELAIAALYSKQLNMFSESTSSYGVVNDVAGGDLLMGVWAQVWERLYNHQWSQASGNYTSNLIKYYNVVTTARLVAKQIAAMTGISDAKKNELLAEANGIAGWTLWMLYDWHGPIPFPTDEDLANPQELNYPQRPTSEETVKIIENFFSGKDDLMDPDFGAGFGRLNKQIANLVLLRLYMLEAGRTRDVNFWKKAQAVAEEIINSGSYTLLKDYDDIFSLAGRKNHEIIFAPASDYSFFGTPWSTYVLPPTYPCKQNLSGSGAFAVIRMVWDFYDTYDPADYRLSGIITSYVSTPAYGSILIDRDHPYDLRNGVGGGPFPLKYELDPNIVGSSQAQDFIVYRYADVILSMAEILNELGTTANVDAPAMTQLAKNGTALTSDGGRTSYSFINAIRVRAGLQPLSGLSKTQLRDSILMERGHELYAEGTRRTDLIRYQRMTNSLGYKKFDSDTTKYLMPFPNSFINEYKGNIVQNPGY